MLRKKRIIGIFLSIIVIFLTSIAIDSYIFPTYFKADDADMLLCVKYYFNKNIDSIFSTAAPNANFYKGAGVMWAYYRPLERLLWIVFFNLFGFNPKPLHIFEIFLFILSLWFLHYITNFLAGSTTRIPGLLFIFIFLYIFPQFSNSLLSYLSHSNTILMLFFITLSIVYFISAYQNRSNKNLLFGMFFYILASLSKEWSYYALPSLLLMLFYFCWNQADDEQKRIILKSIIFIICGWLFIFIVQSMFISSTYGYRQGQPFLFGFKYFSYGVEFFANLLKNNSAWLLMIFSVSSLIMLRNKGQVISLFWVVIVLIPSFFFKNLAGNQALHYLLLAIIGLSMLISISLYLNIRYFLLSLIREDKKTYWLRELYKKTYLTNIFILINLVLALIASFIIVISPMGTFRYLVDISKGKREEYFQRKNNFDKASFATSNHFFYVTSEPAKKFYRKMLDVFGREDVKVEVFNFDINNINKRKTEENILKNGSFENGLESWKVNFDEIIFVSQSQAFIGNSSLEVNLDSVNKISDNFIDVSQDIKVKCGQMYIFGAWLKAQKFNGRMWLEVRNKVGYKYGCWIAPFTGFPTKEKEDWVSISNIFVPQTDNLTFIVLRLLAPITGKVYIDDLYLFPIYEDFLQYE